MKADIRNILEDFEKNRLNTFEAFEHIERLKNQGNNKSGSVFSRTFTYDEPFLGDHQGNNPFDENPASQVLLGVTHCSLAVEAARLLHPENKPVHIHKLVIAEPIILYPGEMVDIAVKIKKTGEVGEEKDEQERINFTNVYKRSSGTTYEIAASGEYIFAPLPHPGPIDSAMPDKFRNHYERTLSSEEIYGQKESMRGSSLKIVKKIWICDKDVLGEISLTREITNNSYHYHVHPALLDGAFVSSLSNLPADIAGSDDPTGVWIPFMIKNVYVYASLPGSCFCYSKLVKTSPGLLSVDIYFCDGNGKIFLVLNEFTYRYTKSRQQRNGTVKGSTLEKEIEKYLANKLSIVLGTDNQVIEKEKGKNFMDLGIDSNHLVVLSQEIEKELEIELYPTLFFEYQNIKELSSFFINEHREAFSRHLQPSENLNKSFAGVQGAVFQKSPLVAEGRENIAIIGMAGRFSGSPTLEEFWENLKTKKNLITEIPPDHWDYRPWFDENREAPNKTYCKWGSFIEIDRFDPLFFGITPREAVWMDPQLRILLEVVHAALEDAGYGGKASISETGVFVGTCFQEYWYEILRAHTPIVDYQASSSIMSSLSGRISYTFDLQGESIPLDNACASSLTAVHLACKALRNNECEMAFAAGSNLLLSPLHYVHGSRAQSLSPTGQCHTFDSAADGYVPGEGVAVILLKPLSRAIADNDNIYAVITGTAANHVGRSNNPTAPRPELQEKLLIKAWKDAGINPETITYIEAHGTGTSLGDPIEITALKKAFGHFTSKKEFCTIGSAKAHIGHLEGAAGIASLIKTVLSMKNKQIPPMPGFKELNPYIKPGDFPFVINKELRDWVTGGSLPRRAGVSSFGISGNNVHIVLEEYVPVQKSTSSPRLHMTPLVFVFSARDEERLKVYAGKIVGFLEKIKSVDQSFLIDMVYTLQAGKEAMEERLAILATGIEELKDKLNRYCCGKGDVAELYRGSESADREKLGVLLEGEDPGTFIKSLIDNRKLNKLAQCWVSGLEIDWKELYRDYSPHRVSLPTYPFKKDRYWIPRSNDNPRHVDMNGENPVIIYYHGVWEKSDPESRETVKDLPEKILVFENGEEIGKAIKEMQQNSKEQDRNPAVIRVNRGESFKKLGDRLYQINPESSQDYLKLFMDLKSQNLLPHQLLHLWTMDIGGENGNNRTFCSQDFIGGKGEELSGAFISRGIYSIFHLVKAISEVKVRSLKRFIFFYARGSGGPNPFLEAAAGYSRSLEFIFPHLVFSTVEVVIGGTGEDSPTVTVVRELSMPGEHRDIRREKGQRYVKKMKPLLLEKSGNISIESQGVYLVTGGAGGLGLVFARHLARNYRAKLILTGRSELTPEKQEQIRQLGQSGSEVLYLKADAASREDMKAVMETIKNQLGGLNGVIHAAGVGGKNILENDIAGFAETLRPKVQGIMVVDEVTRDESLDFFVVFSSASSVLGDIGLCDYAVGNRFLDSYVKVRETLRKNKQRQGQTIGINWPLWREGGMHISREAESLYLKSSGMAYLESDTGIKAFEEILSSGISQVLIIHGEPGKVERIFKTKSEIALREIPIEQQVESDIQRMVSAISGIPEDKLKVTNDFGAFGFDSLSLKEFSVQLNKTYKIEISPTVFFTRSNIRRLATHLQKEFGEEISSYYTHPYEKSEPSEPVLDRAHREKVFKVSPKEPVAIIGASGILPGSRDLDEFWNNLEKETDLIIEIPGDRWDWRDYYSGTKIEENKTNSKWGGFISDVDKFDARFFSISPLEAQLMDPQHRLFLETVWKTIEDSGYRVSQFSGRNIGVFVGVQFNDYQELLENCDEILAHAHVGTGNANTMLCNRISYLYNLRGPSESIDTACSSSLVAVHRAVKSIQYGESEMAIAGGVSLLLSPYNYIVNGQAGALSPVGRCKTFDKSADGYVKGEGVGALLLKPLTKATADHDHIYAVIKGSAVNHGGKANSLTAPNPEAQAALLAAAYEEAGIDPESITYIETHGTATELGDPLEIQGLQDAFAQLAETRQKSISGSHYCGLGTVKTNIGHLEPAAGIAGILKVILAMKNEKLPGNPHFRELNPYIELENTPFYVVKKTKPWERSADEQGNPLPRRAGVSSFGFGGTNAHVVLEEFEPLPVKPVVKSQGPQLILLSAKNEDRLKVYAKKLADFLEKTSARLSLLDIAYTLQAGREEMEERLAIIASGVEELKEKLNRYSRGQTVQDIENLYRGNEKANKEKIELPTEGEDIQAFVNKLINNKKINRLARLWVSGLETEIDWNLLYPPHTPSRIALPTYPFARERHWIPGDIQPGYEENRKPEPDKHPEEIEDEEILNILKGIKSGELDVQQADQMIEKVL